MYKESIVSYIEILGFDDLITNKNIGEALHVLELVEFLCEYTDSSSDFSNSPDKHINHTSISGCIVRSIDSDLGSTENEVYALGLLQARITLHGYIIKGGVSVGNLYISDNEVFGPALSQAKSLDTNLAFFPRILVLEKTINNSKYIKVDHDGLRFIDYLQVYADLEPSINSVIDGEDESENLYTLLKSHKELIQITLEHATNKYDTCSQYLWLKNYHNSFVKNCTHITDEEKDEIYY